MDTTTTLLDRTKALLDRRGALTIEQVAAGAGVNRWWLHRLAQGAPQDFGVRRVQAVHDWLAAREQAAEVQRCSG